MASGARLDDPWQVSLLRFHVDGAESRSNPSRWGRAERAAFIPALARTPPAAVVFVPIVVAEPGATGAARTETAGQAEGAKTGPRASPGSVTPIPSAHRTDGNERPTARRRRRWSILRSDGSRVRPGTLSSLAGAVVSATDAASGVIYGASLRGGLVLAVAFQACRLHQQPGEDVAWASEHPADGTRHGASTGCRGRELARSALGRPCATAPLTSGATASAAALRPGASLSTYTFGTPDGHWRAVFSRGTTGGITTLRLHHVIG